MTEQTGKDVSHENEFTQSKKDEINDFFDNKLTGIKNEIDQHIANKVTEIEQAITPLNTNIEKITNDIINCQDKLEKFDSISEEHQTQLTNYFEENSKRIDTLISEIDEVKNKTDSAYEEVNEKHQEIFGHATKHRKKLTEEEIDEIITNSENKEEFDGNLVYHGNDTQGNKYQYIYIENRKPGVVDLLTELRGTISSLIDETNTKVKEFISDSKKTYLELFTKIEEAYKGAIGLSLAKGFNKAKEAHKTSLNFWTFALIISILLIICIPSVLEIWIFETKITTLTTIHDVFRRILTYLTFIFPLFFFIYICTKNLNGHRRMYEEYLHKESTSLTFEGLKREIAKLPDDDISSEFLQQLLGQSLDATKVNPSLFLDNIKGEQPLAMLSEIVSGKNISIKTFPFRSIKIDELNKRKRIDKNDDPEIDDNDKE